MIASLYYGWLLRVSLRHTMPVLLCYLPLAFVAICSLAFLRARKDGRAHTRAALRALLVVIAPTCSLWPSRYIKLASVSRSRVDIPLEVIFADTVNGIIEFCNPVNDLADLMSSGACVNGHTICIYIGWKWWITYFRWWMLAELNSGYMLKLSDWLHSSAPSAKSNPLDLFLGHPTLTSSTSRSLLCLDSLPRGTTPPLAAGCKAILEFTAFSPSLRILSTAQIISAVPFIMSGHSRRWPRSLVSVLQQLSVSYDPSLVVDSFSNVSADYGRTLSRIYKTSSGERKIREMEVKNLGIKIWRQDTFLVALEAALVRRGWIERWAVQVTAK